MVEQERVPANLTEADFAVVGRFVVTAASLEGTLVILASVARWQADRTAPGGKDQLRQTIRDELFGATSGPALKSLKENSSTLQDFATGRYLEDLWADCEELLLIRHAVVHGYWLATSTGAASVERPIPRFRRKSEDDLVSLGSTLDELPTKTEQIEDTIRDVVALLDSHWPIDWPLVPDQLRPLTDGAARRPHQVR